ncbi:MAG: acetyl-CoA hydrolase/transferase C-terminal domain-containing protein [Myxococcota bacterium]
MEELSAGAAADRVHGTDSVVVPLGPGQPAAFLHALGERPRFERLVVFASLLIDLFPLFARPGVRLLSGFYGPAERALRDAGHDVHFVPADFRRFTKIARKMSARVMATAATPPDSDGWCSLSLHAGATVDELLRAGRDPERLLMVEANPKLPRTLGLGESRHALHVDDIDVLIASDREPPVLPDARSRDVERAIAGHAARFIPEGATLQTGIGGIPDAVAAILAERDGGGYGIHSEMFTTGLMKLHQAGKITNDRKGLNDGYSICTFAMGTREMYDWLEGEGQDLVRFLPVDDVNTPSLIAQNRRMVSINGALSVDLVGQVVADHLGGREYSGIGGHEDFVMGASFSEEGRSLICLPSTAGGEDGFVSRIVSEFTPTTCITTPRHQVDVVVTEQGAAELAGLTTKQRRDALIAIAHPDARDALARAAARD